MIWAINSCAVVYDSTLMYALSTDPTTDNAWSPVLDSDVKIIHDGTVYAYTGNTTVGIPDVLDTYFYYPII
jgi:hypothetical protein